MSTSKASCGCVYATALNTESVRKGYEMGGYIKNPCARHAKPWHEVRADEIALTAPTALALALARVKVLEAELDALRTKTFNGSSTEALAAVLLTVGHDVAMSYDALLNARKAIVEVREDFAMGCNVIRAYVPRAQR